MRVETSFHDEPSWATEPVERDSVTLLYVKPAPEPRLSPRPSVRSYEVEDRFAMPSVVARRSHPETLAVRRVPRAVVGLGFAAICVLLGVFLGGLIVFGSDRGSSASAAPRARAVAPSHVTAPVTVARPAAVTVRIESDPPGATAMIVDGGKTTLVGMTPVDTQLDGARAYDLILTLEGHDTKIVQLDPATTHRVTVSLPAVSLPATVVDHSHHHHTEHRAVVADHAPARSR